MDTGDDVFNVFRKLKGYTTNNVCTRDHEIKYIANALEFYQHQTYRGCIPKSKGTHFPTSIRPYFADVTLMTSPLGHRGLNVSRRQYSDESETKSLEHSTPNIHTTNARTCTQCNSTLTYLL